MEKAGLGSKSQERKTPQVKPDEGSGNQWIPKHFCRRNYAKGCVSLSVLLGYISGLVPHFEKVHLCPLTHKSVVSIHRLGQWMISITTLRPPTSQQADRFCPTSANSQFLVSQFDQKISEPPDWFLDFRSPFQFTTRYICLKSQKDAKNENHHLLRLSSPSRNPSPCRRGRCCCARRSDRERISTLRQGGSSFHLGRLSAI